MQINFRKIIQFILFLLLIASFSCNRSEPDRAMVISKLKNSAKLATVEYIVTKIITAKDNNLFAKDAYFFAETEATIKAGIDLDKLKDEDVKIDGTKISILLPAIEIVNFSYPSEGFKVIEKYSDETAIFKWNSIGVATKDDLYRQGETDIRQNINDMGIIKTAKKNTRVLLTKILSLSGFEEIYIDFKHQETLSTQDETLLKELEEFLKKERG
ncbi:MAG: hypothetical protein B6I20_01015 [Bacteroidetes bacterium 4572_117]|nr:MAG: hypothetical protein B6I20_01015 [Bacteroidetes bacterium 4572_117]